MDLGGYASNSSRHERPIYGSPFNFKQSWWFCPVEQSQNPRSAGCFVSCKLRNQTLKMTSKSRHYERSLKYDFIDRVSRGVEDLLQHCIKLK